MFTPQKIYRLKQTTLFFFLTVNAHAQQGNISMSRRSSTNLVVSSLQGVTFCRLTLHQTGEVHMSYNSNLYFISFHETLLALLIHSKWVPPSTWLISSFNQFSKALNENLSCPSLEPVPAPDMSDVTGNTMANKKWPGNTTQHGWCVCESVRRSVAFSVMQHSQVHLIQMRFEMIESFLIWKSILLS